MSGRGQDPVQFVGKGSQVSGGVAHQVSDGHRPFSWNGGIGPIVCDGSQDFIGESRNILRDRIVQIELSLFIQGHERYGDDGLGLGIKDVDVVRTCRHLVFQVLEPKGLLIDHITALGDESGSAGHLTLVHEALQDIIERGYLLLGDSQFLGFDLVIELLGDSMPVARERNQSGKEHGCENESIHNDASIG